MYKRRKNEFKNKDKKEIDELVEFGENLSKLASESGSGLMQDLVIKTSSWTTRIGHIILKLYSKESIHYQNFEKTLSTGNFYSMHSNHYLHLPMMTGVIKAIQHEYNNDLLDDIKFLIQADIFADFLEMAEYLLNENYKDASAVLIGGVLENSLRKLSEKHLLPVENDNGKMLTLEPLNVQLAKANVYDKLIQKQITSWGELRNKAAHGEYLCYDKSQVEMMLLFVQKFSSEYL
jgi:hypothetical protein